jgi:hypothetical protein
VADDRDPSTWVPMNVQGLPQKNCSAPDECLADDQVALLFTWMVAYIMRTAA